MSVTAYVPCHVADPSIDCAVNSILSQTVPIGEVFIIDDGSIRSIESTRCLRVIRSEVNRGRGAARATAMAAAKGEFVLGCDSSLVIPPSFLEVALPWFKDDRVAAVFGWIRFTGEITLAQRWRSRHLFRLQGSPAVQHGASFNTSCSVARNSAVKLVGGYDCQLREKEDYDLGVRLLKSGFDVVFDPDLWALTDKVETVMQVLSRYARWNAQGRMGFVEYIRHIVYAIKVMAVADLKGRDPLSAAVSLFAPHYQLWYSWIHAPVLKN